MLSQPQSLIEPQTSTRAALDLITDTQHWMHSDLLAMKVAARAYAYLGHALRQVILPDPGPQGDRGSRLEQDPPRYEIEDRLEQHLTPDELQEVLLLDVPARGRPRPTLPPVDQEVWVAVEASAVVDKEDVERADRRAALLRKAGLRAIPAVAGESMTQGATKLLQDLPVVMILDGRSEGWSQALAAI
jgi:hypothetical protein